MNKSNFIETKLKKFNDVALALLTLVTRTTIILGSLINLVIQAKTFINWFGNF